MISIEAYCTFCRTRLIPEDYHMECPKCHAGFGVSVSPYPMDDSKCKGCEKLDDYGCLQMFTQSPCVRGSVTKREKENEVQ